MLRTPENETLLNIYRKRRGLTLAALGNVLEVSGSQAGRYCLPRNHKRHDRPGVDVSERLRLWSGGEITVANYADPYEPASDAVLRANLVPHDTQ